MSKNNSLWAVLVAAMMVALLFLGLKSDLKAIPPSFGPGCTQGYDEVWAQAPPAENPPPPGKAAAGGGQDPLQEPLALFAHSELSSRAGFDHTLSKDPETWARRLGAGWYLDWHVARRYPTQKPEHWQMVRLGNGCISPNPEAIRWVAEHYRGSVWIIGNEPDNIWQDNLLPETYAQAYHDLYVLIKAADPQASIAVAGVTQGTPLRLAYLDRVLEAYERHYAKPMPVDWWTLHGFVLREERGSWGAEIPPGFPSTQVGALYEIADTGSLDLFKTHIIDFRTWMAARGYRETPLAITEFGILISDAYGYTPEVVASYLQETFMWLDQARDEGLGDPLDGDRLVQRWAWFSLTDKLFYSSNLIHDKSGTLTAIGWAFREFAEERRP